MSEKLNPVKNAIQMEIDGIAFYEKAAKNTQNPLGKKMFLSFVEDERKHLKTLESIFKGVSIDSLHEAFSGTSPKARIKTVFSEAKAELDKDSQKAGSSDIEALETAMKMEKEGYDYYIEVAKKAESAEIKKLFNMLANEENEHYTILSNSHTYLTDNGNWFIWEEAGIIDGG